MTGYIVDRSARITNDIRGIRSGLAGNRSYYTVKGTVDLHRASLTLQGIGIDQGMVAGSAMDNNEERPGGLGGLLLDFAERVVNPLRTKFSGPEVMMKFGKVL